MGLFLKRIVHTKSFGFVIFRIWAYLMNVILETRRAH
jgi:hypothetical protein